MLLYHRFVLYHPPEQLLELLIGQQLAYQR